MIHKMIDDIRQKTIEEMKECILEGTDDFINIVFDYDNSYISVSTDGKNNLIVDVEDADGNRKDCPALTAAIIHSLPSWQDVEQEVEEARRTSMMDEYEYNGFASASSFYNYKGC